jgi:sec-independent protein translocase protein TatB
MFDLAWSEIALIGIVALVVIGPKDLPEAIRGVARGVQKLRRMASEFRGQADELVREANLDEVRSQIHEVRSAVNEIRSFDLKGEVERNIDADGSIRRSFQDDPLKPDWSVAPAFDAPAAAPAASSPPVVVAEPPAFIPPADAERVLAARAVEPRRADLPTAPPPAPNHAPPPAWLPPSAAPEPSPVPVGAAGKPAAPEPVAVHGKV